MPGTRLILTDHWQIGEGLGAGGFGSVYAARRERDDFEAAIKYVPKMPGADRELLFVNLTDVPNVVPIIDSGETDTHWVLVMPRADYSLEDHRRQEGALTAEAVLDVLRDVVSALVDLAEKGVVHRDLKPANVLYLNGIWCLSDFGISRYAEATTAVDTQKFALTMAYAAPERWRMERATAAADIYAFGIMAYELFSGSRPFAGPTDADYRDQHLH